MTVRIRRWQLVALIVAAALVVLEAQVREGTAFKFPNGVLLLSDVGSPEGSKTAPIGSYYIRSSDGRWWRKATGAGNTGWVQTVPVFFSATDRVLCRDTAGSGDAEECTASQIMDMVGSTRGGVLYRGASGWSILTGNAGECLKSGGAGADPSYGNCLTGSGGGDVTAASNFANDNRLIRSDGTTKGVQASAATLDDSGNLTVTSCSGCGGGSSSTIITPDTYANIPAAGTAGRLFLPTDSVFALRDSGSAWVPWGPLYALTLPDNSIFSWVNQGGASVATTNGPIDLLSRTDAQLAARAATAPGTPWSYTMLFQVDVEGSTGLGGCGAGFRESSSGKLATFALLGTTTLEIQKWTNPTTFSTNYTTISGFVPSNGGYGQTRTPVWIQWGDDGTNRYFNTSINPIKWRTLHSIGRTDFLTADQMVLMCAPFFNAQEVELIVFSLKQG